MTAKSATVPIPHRIDEPELIPAARYYDDEFYRLECENFWPHAWQMACRVEQIPEIGDFVEYTNVGKSVVVVRTADGIKAFHNVCRHRGVKVANRAGNCNKVGFVCPFHGWRYDINGKNTFVFARELFSASLLKQDDLNLVPVKTEEWLGCVFINFDMDAPSYRESLGPMGDGFHAYNTENMRAEWWYAAELPANWKLAMEAFMEGYHVMKTHPDYHALIGKALQYGPYVPVPNYPAEATVREIIEWQYTQLEFMGRGMKGMCHAKDLEIAKAMIDVEGLPEDKEAAVMTWYGMVNQAVMELGRERGEPVPDLNEIAMNTPVQVVSYLFPHFFLLPSLSSMASYRIRPLGPERCLFEIWSLTHFPEGEAPPPLMEPQVFPHDSKEFPSITQEDFANIPLQQSGLHGGGFEFMRLAKDTEGLISNYQRIIDGYLEGKPLEQLSKATQKLSGNFDGPIKDLGL